MLFFCAMKKILIAVVLSGAGSFISLLHAQTQFSGWLASFNTVKTGKRTSLHTDIQWRSSDEWKHTQTLLLRPGLNVHLQNGFIITAGYAYISNRRVIDTATGYTPEHRVWEQLLYNHKLERLAVTHRLRLEQRFLARAFVEDGRVENKGTVHANRLRYFIRNIFPIQHVPVFSKGIFAALQNEVFLNIGNTTHVNGKFFDQNRLYLAVGYRLSPSLDLETGYLNHYTKGRSSFTNNHVLQAAGYLRL